MIYPLFAEYKLNFYCLCLTPLNILSEKIINDLIYRACLLIVTLNFNSVFHTAYTNIRHLDYQYPLVNI